MNNPVQSLNNHIKLTVLIRAILANIWHVLDLDRADSVLRIAVQQGIRQCSRVDVDLVVHLVRESLQMINLYFNQMISGGMNAWWRM